MSKHVVRKETYTTGEVAEILQAVMGPISRDTIRKWVIEVGRFQAHRVGRAGWNRIPRAEVIEFCERNRIPVHEVLKDE